MKAFTLKWFRKKTCGDESFREEMVSEFIDLFDPVQIPVNEKNVKKFIHMFNDIGNEVEGLIRMMSKRRQSQLIEHMKKNHAKLLCLRYNSTSCSKGFCYIGGPCPRENPRIYDIINAILELPSKKLVKAIKDICESIDSMPECE